MSFTVSRQSVPWNVSWSRVSPLPPMSSLPYPPPLPQTMVCPLVLSVLPRVLLV